MALQQIDAKMLSKMFLAGAKNLENKKEWINELNVFPVPDGDTGTNMTMTIMAAAAEVGSLGEPDMESLAKAISSGSLRGARGNSGVILSQLLRGFTKKIRDYQELNAEILAEAMEKAVETAYKAVMKPKEGTILTVAKGAAEKAAELAPESEDLNAFIEAAKAAPGQLKACTEVGAYTYYELLAFEKAADIDLDLVDVGSNSDKIAAMLSGQVDLMPGAYINCKDYLESGQFNCIGAPTEERYDLIKDIPTLKEQGVDLVYPDCDFSFYFPADTSDDVIAYYEDLVQKVLADPSAAEGVANVDMMPYYLNAEDSAKNDEQIYNTIKEIADSLEQ